MGEIKLLDLHSVCESNSLSQTRQLGFCVAKVTNRLVRHSGIIKSLTSSRSPDRRISQPMSISHTFASRYPGSVRRIIPLFSMLKTHSQCHPWAPSLSRDSFFLWVFNQDSRSSSHPLLPRKGGRISGRERIGLSTR